MIALRREIERLERDNEKLRALAYHPNGQPYKEHWGASLVTVCQLWERYIGPCPFN